MFRLDNNYKDLDRQIINVYSTVNYKYLLVYALHEMGNMSTLLIPSVYLN